MELDHELRIAEEAASEGSGCRVHGLGLKVQSLGFRVQGLGLGA